MTRDSIPPPITGQITQRRPRTTIPLVKPTVLRRPVELKQFTAWTFSDRARKSGLLPSMGSVGDCYDNAMMEAFWSRMQVELLDTRRWKTRVELANAIFEYIEVFHNRRRRHSSLGMLTPIEYELNNINTQTQAA